MELTFKNKEMQLFKHLKTTWVLLLMVTGLLASCGKESSYEGDHFFLRSEGADMPVTVRGNKISKTFILVLHGGPGSYVSEYIGSPSFNKLEKDYAVVYWDQRASGDAQGNASPKSLTREQFTQDLDKLVELIGFKYRQPDIVLLGHSWGGALGSLYLSSRKQQDKIKGWIMVDGLYENSLSYQLSRRFVMTYAQKQIDTGNDIREWEKIIEYYEQHPTIELGDLFKHSQYVDKANGYYYTEKPIEGSLGLFNSPRSGLAELYNSRYVGKKNVKGILGGLDISDQLQNITVPTLVLWGRHDGILPAPLAQEYYSKLGTPDSQKSLVIFEESAHSPMFEEPAKFASEVILFINRNK